jgi:hypothetical protein
MSLNLAVKYADVIHSVILQVSFFDGLCYLVYVVVLSQMNKCLGRTSI